MADVFKINCLDPVIYAVDDEGNPKIMYNCGKCSLCRERKRKQWASRMEMESLYNKSCYFVTLTYDDDNLPLVPGTDFPTLNKLHYKNFLKLIRKKLPCSVRFFGVGEYGSESGRPHYHFICWLPEYMNKQKFRDIVTSCWRFGFNTVKNANVQRFYYIAKYCCKDTTKPSIPSIDGFQSCSQSPPIGYKHFERNHNLYNDIECNYMVSPSFRKCSLPRSFESRIRKDLDKGYKGLTPPSFIRSKRLQLNASRYLRQYLNDIETIGFSEFGSRRDAIEFRIKSRNLSSKTNKI